MNATNASFRRRHPVIVWVSGGVLVALIVLAIVVSAILHHAEPFVRARIVAALEDHFHAHVELDSFNMSLVDGLRAEGKGLSIWPPAQSADGSEPDLSVRPADQPMIHLNLFRFHAPLRVPVSGTVHISRIQLQGLSIHLPPHSYFQHEQTEKKSSGADKLPLQFAVDTIVCRDVLLVHETDKPGKLPLEIPITQLTMTHVSGGGAIGFDASLIIPRPMGPIHSKGTFGPWVVDHPGQSPVAGGYEFDHADLSVFKGIAGSLTSAGRYQGNLNNITVDGQADVPNFSLTHFDNPLPLHTTFHATVDGTDGDTWLQPVDATLLHSHFTAQGEIVRVMAADPNAMPHIIGRDINLKVIVDHGRIEDFLALVSHSHNPVLTGAVSVTDTLHIPPGQDLVYKRMTLDGHFILDQAAFTNPKVQDRIAELSLRGQGHPKEVKTVSPDSIHSTMEGDFKMANGVITLPNLRYMVPGAEIDLKGTYGIDGGALQFTGMAKLQATVSKVAGGWKGVLLTPLDPLFKKDGAGTAVPIHVGGTRDDPSFGIDFKRF